MISSFAKTQIQVYTITRDSAGAETLQSLRTVLGYLEQQETNTIDKTGVRIACDGTLYVRDISIPYPDVVFVLAGKYYQPVTRTAYTIGIKYTKFKVQETSAKWAFQ